MVSADVVPHLEALGDRLPADDAALIRATLDHIHSLRLEAALSRHRTAEDDRHEADRMTLRFGADLS